MEMKRERERERERCNFIESVMYVHALHIGIIILNLKSWLCLRIEKCIERNRELRRENEGRMRKRERERER